MTRKKLNTMPESHELTAEQTPGITRAAEAINELTRMNAEATDNAQALAEQLGYDGSLTVGALEDEIRFYQRRSVEAVLELGKRLIILRELTPHGEFSKRIELLDISDRMAQKFMASTLKFSNANSNSLLKAAGTQTKMLELLALDDGEIEALENGETVRGLNLDKIDTMSVRELKAALRERDEVIATKERQIIAKNTKLDELDAQLSRKIDLPSWDERVGDLNGELSMISLGCEELLEKYYLILAALVNAEFTGDECQRAKSMLAKNFLDKTNRIVDRVAFIQSRVYEEFDGFVNETRHLLQPTGSEGSEG